MRYRLRTLLIVLAVLPPVLWFGWTKYEEWLERQRALAEREYRAAVARLEQEQRNALDRWLKLQNARAAMEGQLMPADREALRKPAPATLDEP